MNRYPYFVVQRRVGRIQCPLQYRRTAIEKQFRSGRIGGCRVEEETHYTAQDTQQAVLRAQRDSLEVFVYVVERPNSPRVPVFNCHGRVWTIRGRHIPINEIDEKLQWPKSSLSTETSGKSSS